MSYENSIFCLSYSYYEEQYDYLFIGPAEISQDQFKILCDSLLEQSAINAVDKQSLEEYDSWIGWNDIVQFMSELLTLHNFKILVPKKVEYWGSSIIRDADDRTATLSAKAFAVVSDHNAKIEAMQNFRYQ